MFSKRENGVTTKYQNAVTMLVSWFILQISSQVYQCTHSCLPFYS